MTNPSSKPLFPEIIEAFRPKQRPLYVFLEADDVTIPGDEIWSDHRVEWRPVTVDLPAVEFISPIRRRVHE